MLCIQTRLVLPLRVAFGFGLWRVVQLLVAAFRIRKLFIFFDLLSGGSFPNRFQQATTTSGVAATFTSFEIFYEMLVFSECRGGECNAPGEWDVRQQRLMRCKKTMQLFWKPLRAGGQYSFSSGIYLTTGI